MNQQVDTVTARRSRSLTLRVIAQPPKTDRLLETTDMLEVLVDAPILSHNHFTESTCGPSPSFAAISHPVF